MRATEANFLLANILKQNYLRIKCIKYSPVKGGSSEEEVGRAKVVVVSFVAIGGGSVVVMGRANKSL